MKKKIMIAAITLLFIGGTGLLLYPTFSNWVAARNHSSAIQKYTTTAADLDHQTIDEERSKAQQYNNMLTGSYLEDPFIPGSGSTLPTNYTDILNINGMIGYIEIPSIDISLPIYHGTSEATLQKGVGHMQATAFPIGGEGNHSVLTGHSGLSSSKLFTDLEQLETDDIFYINILDETLAYKIDQIIVVDPSDTQELLPVKGEDYITLVTCTPYAINSHRLFVRGTRIDYTEGHNRETTPASNALPWIIGLGIVVILLFAIIIITIVSLRRR